MKKCSEECIPCCDYCKFSTHFTMELDGEFIEAGVNGCALHLDKEHQDIAIGCGYCDDFYCEGVGLNDLA